MFFFSSNYFDTKEELLAKIGKVKADIAFIERKIKLQEIENDKETLPTYMQILNQKKAELKILEDKLNGN